MHAACCSGVDRADVHELLEKENALGLLRPQPKTKGSLADLMTKPIERKLTHTPGVQH